MQATTPQPDKSIKFQIADGAGDHPPVFSHTMTRGADAAGTEILLTLNLTPNFMIAVLTVGLVNLPAHAHADTLIIRNAVIFEATDKAPYKGSVLVRDGRIVEAGPTVKVPKAARVIDAKGQAVVPGLFDVHTHWSASGKPGAYPLIASAYIQSGFTTVNDFNEAPEAFEPLRAWLKTLIAPHVNMVARLSTTNGHGADWADTDTTKWVDTPEVARAEVKALLPYKPDYLKAFADGWRYGQSPDNTSMNRATLSALVDEAHQNGLRVLTHTVTVERGRDAAAARVDVIAHSLQDEQVDAMAVAQIKAAGTSYAPTLAIYEPEPLVTEADRADPAKQLRVRKYGYATHNVKTLYDAGVPIVLGTDAGIGGAVHGEASLHELELLAEAGLSPEAVLRAATINSARALGVGDDRGSIEPGKRADLVIVSGQPWVNVSDMRKVQSVILDGQLVFEKGKPFPAANQATALPSINAVALIDDFERKDGRTSLNTLRTTVMESGMARSLVVPALVPGNGAGQAVLVSADLSAKAQAEAGLVVPLSRGAIQPTDARAFTGFAFDLRGADEYLVSVRTLTGRYQTRVRGGESWTRISTPFSVFKRIAGSGPDVLSGDGLLQVEISAKKSGGGRLSFEVDNLSFE